MKNCNSILKFNKYIVNKVYLVNNENYKEDSVKVCNSLRRNADLIKNSSLTEKRIIQENERVKNDRDSIEYFAKII